MATIRLGLGLLSIGRTWGVRNVKPPAKSVALELIDQALAQGISFLDTAPAYADSESLLGQALSETSRNIEHVTIATKAGEYWNSNEATTSVSHKYDDLVRGIDLSFKRLGKIHLLQLHKADFENVESNDVVRAFKYAESLGVRYFGASVSDLQTAKKACESGRYQFLQFPFNKGNQSLIDIFDMLSASNMEAIVNRPLGMGALADPLGARESIEQAFSYILAHEFNGIILTGTSSVDHLRSNVNHFNSVNHRCG